MKKYLLLFLALVCPALASPRARFTAAATNASVLVAASPSNGYGVRLDYINAGNSNTSPVYVQFFDAATAGAVTPGTTAPLFVLTVPTNGVLDTPYIQPFYFFSGMVYCVTTTPTGGSAPSNTTPVTIHYE